MVSSKSITPFIYVTLASVVVYFNIQTNYLHIVLQGARGHDGDPGPQGVAGATVSLYHCAFFFFFFLTANVLYICVGSI